jgi:hypothetical protein
LEVNNTLLQAKASKRAVGQIIVVFFNNFVGVNRVDNMAPA